MSYASTVLADGAVGYWRLGESAFASPAVDQAGNKNGVYTNTTGLSFSQTGIAGGGGDTAVQFISANSGLVAITSLPAALQLADTCTFEIWVKLTTTGTTYYPLAAGNNTGPGMQLDSSGHIVMVKTGTAVVCTATTAISDTTTFHHCVWTKSGSTCHIYLDGVDVTGSVSNATMVAANSWNIGVGPGAGNPTNATLDEAALYPTALSLATVQNHYTLGSAAAAPVVGNTSFDMSTAWTILG